MVNAGDVNIMFAMSIGQRLKKRLDQLGLSQAEMGRRLGTGQRRFSHYCNDKRQPDFELLVKICREMRTHPNYLFGFDDSPETPVQSEEAISRILNELADIKKRMAKHPVK